MFLKYDIPLETGWQELKPNQIKHINFFFYTSKIIKLTFLNIFNILILLKNNINYLLGHHLII